MLLIRGSAGGTALTGTLYERGETPPTFKGAPEIGGRELNVAFETPMPHGFETRETAIEAAKEHIRTQFARVGLASDDVEVDVIQAEPEPQ
jgi:hypothetical protein